MKISNIRLLMDDLKEDIKRIRRIYSTNTIRSKYGNLIKLCIPHLKENLYFLRESLNINNMEYNQYILSYLEYIELLLKIKEKEEIGEKKLFLDSAKDKLKQAGLAFSNADYSGVSTKLNTCLELALKDLLDIPTTIRGINISKIIEIMLKENIGPVEYLKEVREHVLLDNLVKHQGLSPISVRAAQAIAATENLLKKLPKEGLKISKETKDKIWSGIK